ncbi:MAG: DUF4258 domain-containing protein [Chloroflexi bacterium]|nr:DUF4258 domain-containing protein [Chloroflexota bacterium]
MTTAPDTLQFIKRCVRESKVRWTYHIGVRLRGRAIPVQSVLGSADTFEIIEAYPDDKYRPSYLVYAEHENTPFHVPFGVDLEGDNVRVVTAYYPDPEEWSVDLKVRRRE